MNTRSSRSKVTFRNGFAHPGYPDRLPAGTYEILVEEELLQGLSFEAWRCTATYLIVHETANRGGAVAMRPITQEHLDLALRRDQCAPEPVQSSEAALFPPEDLK